MKEISDEETLVIKDDNLEKVDKELLDEVLDDGMQIIVKGDCQNEVAEYFDDNVNDDSIGKNYALLGYEITANGDDYQCTPISATYALAKGENSKDYSINDLKSKVTLDKTDVLQDVIESNEIDKSEVLSEKISDADKAKIQASNPTGTAYKDDYDKIYVYRKSFWNASVKLASSGSGWERIGAFKIWTYVIKAGTASNKKKTFDAVYTVAQVSGQGGRWVENFTVQNRLYKDGSYADIVDASVLKGGDSTRTATIGLSIEGSKEGLSAGFSAGYSYTYDPCESKIQNQLGDDYIKRWKCTPNDPDGDETYKICPMILVRNTDGVHRSTKVTSRIWEATIGGTYREYYIDNKWADHYTSVSFKNHK